MIKPYKIFILLATYNRAHLIGETLNSIKFQSYKNWECFVVDDHSTDNTSEIVKEFMQRDSRFTYYLKTENYKKGLSGTRNFGLDLAADKGAGYIQFFDDDDIMYPEKLKLQIEPFLRNPDLNFTVCKYEKLVEVEQGNSKLIRPEMSLDFPHIGDALLTGDFKLNSLSGLWNMNLLNKYRFDERLTYAEEWELFIRIGYQHPRNYSVIDRYLFAYRKHPDTLTMGKDENFERRKSSSVSRLIIVDYLTTNHLHTRTSIIFFTKSFLTYQYNPVMVKKLLQYVKKSGNFSNKMIWYLKFALKLSSIHYRLLGKVSNWV